MNQSVVTLIFPLADTLVMDLKFKAKSKMILGKKNMRLAWSKGIEINCSLTVVASFIDKMNGQSGVLVQVRRGMFLLVGYNHKHRVVSLYVVSKDALKGHFEEKYLKANLTDIFHPSMTVKDAVMLLWPGIKAAFMRRTMDNEWESLSLMDIAARTKRVKTMDDSQVRNDQRKDRPDSPTV